MNKIRKAARRTRPAAVPATSDELDRVFAVVARYFGVLSEPTRLKILHAICQAERSVSAIVDGHGRDADERVAALAPHAAGGRREPAARGQHRVLPRGKSRVRRDLPQRLRADRKPHRRAEAAAQSLEFAARSVARQEPTQWNKPHSARRRSACSGAAVLRRASAAQLRAPARRRPRKNLPPNVPEWSRTLGAPVLASPYGVPSKFEANVRRRESPGLTRTPHSSVAFTPLQNLFGIITPSGLHFERHHAGMPGRRPAPASADDPRARGESAHLHDGRHRALSFGVAHPLHRVRREHGHGMVATSRCRPCSTRTACSRAASGPACCCPRCSTRSGIDRAQGEVHPGRRRRRRVADAHDSARQRAGRRDRRVRAERRDAAARAGLSAAPRRPRHPGRVEREVAAPASRSATARGTRARSRCTTSTSCRAASIASTPGSRRRRA